MTIIEHAHGKGLAINMDLRNTVAGLSELSGPSGFEDRAAARVKELLVPYMDETSIDALGNVIGVKRCGKEGAKRLLIDAHIDEVGLIVTGIEEGFVKFAALGGIDPGCLPASDVRILSEPTVFGVVACLPPHVQSAEDMSKPSAIEDMYIDTGLPDEKARELIKPGTAIVLERSCRSLGDAYITGKALDDRAGMAVVLRALELLGDKPLEADLYVMASVQEEIGCRGAKTGVFAIDPDYFVAVDVTEPDPIKCGGGAVITLGPVVNRPITDKLISLAKEKGIPYQIEVEPGSSGINAWVAQISREGVATAEVSLPLKYMHSPAETLKLSDAEAAANLVCELALSMKGEGL